MMISSLLYFAYWILQALAKCTRNFYVRSVRLHSEKPGGGLFGWFVKSHFIRTKLRKDLIRQAVLHCDIQPDDSVLELGFGPGFGLKFAAECVKFGTGQVYGINHSPAMVEEATKLIQRENLLEKVELKLGDVQELPYNDELMDIIFHVNCYYFWDDRQKTITGIHRVLKRGGKMVTVFYKNDLVNAVETRVLTREEVNFERYMDELKLYNFCDVRMEECNHPDSDATYDVIFAYKR